MNEPSVSNTNAAEAALVERYREARSKPLPARERRAEAWLGGVSLLAAVLVAIGFHSERSFDAGIAALFVVGLAASCQVRFAVGAAHTSPSQLVLVPMLFLVPTPLVPLLVMLGTLLAYVPDYLRRQAPLDRVMLVPGDAAYALFPAVVLLLAGSQLPEWSVFPVFMAAMAAQVVGDSLLVTVREWLAFGRVHAPASSWVAVVDLLLAPVGFMAAVASADAPAGWLSVVPLLALIAVFARERKARVDHAIELGNAYRGTTLLLSDVLEADDEYTGSHSWGVVALALRVAEAMGLGHEQRRNVEFGALLHDIGKIAVPKEIINKPGALTDEEWLVIKTHTVEGERMLGRVGGVLGEVGRIVRSSHERWDGGGYPDGLVGEEIPIEACIVSCCDAFDAMTTDRSYRAAMPLQVALAELEENAGTQFHPHVVQTVVELMSPELETASATDARTRSAPRTLGTPVPAPSPSAAQSGM
jgi:putative nucleotidyltransferase with HDIG domain